jgi:hypothetical protein
MIVYEKILSQKDKKMPQHLLIKKILIQKQDQD